MRALSSSRCSRKLIEFMGSRSDSRGSSSATSDMAAVGWRVYVWRRWIRVGPLIRQSESRGRNRFRDGLDLGQTLLLLLLFLFELQLRNFRFNLRFELVGCALELTQSLSHLTSNLRQFLGAEQQQGKNEQNNGVRKTHA